jgi:hypothetical protein
MESRRRGHAWEAVRGEADPQGALKAIPWSCRYSGAARLISAYILARVKDEPECPYKHDRIRRLNTSSSVVSSCTSIFTFETHPSCTAYSSDWILMPKNRGLTFAWCGRRKQSFLLVGCELCFIEPSHVHRFLARQLFD